MKRLTPRIDLHTHTCHSFDSEADPCALCDAAVTAGLSALAITDHVDMPACKEADTAASVADARALQAAYDGRLLVLAGVELGEPLHDPAQTARLLDTYAFDVVLASLHNVQDQLDFYDIAPADPALPALLDRYFDELLAMVAWGRFDVLAHLTYPWRYLAPEAREPALRARWERVDAVLRALAHSGKALEINTSGYRQGLGEPLPGLEVARRFREVGGDCVTLGSDAHTPAVVGDAVDRGIDVARAAGFAYVTVYREHKPSWIKL